MAKKGTKKSQTKTPPPGPRKVERPDIKGPAMVTLNAMITDVGPRKVVVRAEDADKVIAKFMQTGFKEKMTNVYRPYRVYAPGKIERIDIEPVQ